MTQDHKNLDLMGVMGTVMGSLSLILLLQQGLTLGFIAPLEMLLQWYRRAVDVIFWPLALIVDGLVQVMNERWPDLIRLSPDWKQYLVFGLVIMGAFFRASKTPSMRTAGFAAFMLTVTQATNPAPALEGLMLLLLVTVALYAVLMPLLSPLLAKVDAVENVWTWRETARLFSSLFILLGSVIVFISLNAGLSLAGL